MITGAAPQDSTFFITLGQSKLLSIFSRHFRTDTPPIAVEWKTSKTKLHGAKMNESQIEQSVRSAIATALSLDSKLINQDSMLIRDLGAESIDFLDITYEIEQRLGRELNFLEILRFAQQTSGAPGRDLSVQSIVAYLAQQKK
jgi:acyl carrier protein